MEDQDVDKLFQKAFAEAEETPSDRVWENIESALPTEQKTVVLPKRNYRWLYYAALLAVCIAASLFIYRVQETVPVGKDTTVANRNLDSSIHTESDKEISLEIAAKPTQHASPVADVPSAIVQHAQHTDADTDMAQTGGAVARNNTSLAAVKLTEGKRIELHNLTADMPSSPIIEVTEIADIKPLIESDEDMDTMLAQVNSSTESNRNVVTSLLNVLAENIGTEISNKKEIRFRADEEGSFRIDIVNSLVKNRNKKRK
ncbi:hypothetical protein ACL9RF_08550 [Sphingobacterium sp. Mn56C]|uniref:hypothetical protein n=1 Tax=Sphingobacterium sp. Mn56C TaxID=3395261 RepID=UPI003BE94AB6